MSDRLFLRLDEDPLHGPEASVPQGTLRAFAVAAPLAAYVSHILLYREQLPADREIHEHVLPDGAVRLVFNFGDAPTSSGLTGQAMEVIGASAAPVRVRLAGRIDGLSLTLRPGAVAALLGRVPAGDIDARVVPLEALWGRAAGALFDHLATAASDAARVAALQRALAQRLHEAGMAAPHPGAAHAAALIAAAQGQASPRQVAEAIGVGERRLQQLFHTHVGLTPRAWSRLARMRSCLRALRTLAQPPTWADLAVERGYYDQAHLANEFRALCGMTPTEFLRRSASHSSKTAA